MGAVDFRQLEEKFFLTLYEPENTVLTMPASDLIIEEDMMRLIDTYGLLIKTEERSAAAAFFMSWYAGICSAMQHMLFRGDELLLDLSLSNVTVQLYAGDHYPLFSFKINEQRFRKIPITGGDAWRKKTLDSFYRENITPLIVTLSRLVQMSAIPLWGQIVNALYSQMEEELGDASDEKSRKMIVYPFQMLKWGIDASAFGLRKNPFDIKLRYIEHPTIPEKKIRLKTACCLAYRLNTEFDYCYECPRLNEKDRALKRANGHC
ncbi:hypothetical protein [Candidatus Pristimantibacillus sp. PTI5]|uniref:hypothetical protein n=1 Tax=Candidatus Pristimantibacillus sp. PTI5 TaxID=3400422 RepID=UPI003B017D8C